MVEAAESITLYDGSNKQGEYELLWDNEGESVVFVMESVYFTSEY